MTVASLPDWTPGPDREARRRTADYARRHYQLSRAGEWAPFTDTGPVREHLQVLREAGVTLEQIGGVAGVSVATLSRAAKEPRMTSAAADAIMAIPVPAAHPDERPGAVVAERLRTLVADGRTLVQIAEATGLSERALQRQMHEQVPPMRGTVEAIDRAYDQLIVEDPGDGYIAARARARAERAGWQPSTAPPPPKADIDDVAVERVVAGDRLPLRPAEQQVVLNRLAGVYPTTRSPGASTSARGPCCGTATATSCPRTRVTSGVPTRQRPNQDRVSFETESKRHPESGRSDRAHPRQMRAFTRSA